MTKHEDMPYPIGYRALKAILNSESESDKGITILHLATEIEGPENVLYNKAVAELVIKFFGHFLNDCSDHETRTENSVGKKMTEKEFNRVLTLVLPNKDVSVPFRVDEIIGLRLKFIHPSKLSHMGYYSFDMEYDFAKKEIVIFARFHAKAFNVEEEITRSF